MHSTFHIYRCRPAATLDVAACMFNRSVRAYAPHERRWVRRRHGPPKLEFSSVLPGFIFVHEDDNAAAALLGRDPHHPMTPMLVSWRARNPRRPTGPLLLTCRAATVDLHELHLIAQYDAQPPAEQDTTAAPTVWVAGDEVTVKGGPFTGILGTVHTVKGPVCEIKLQTSGLRLQIAACMLRAASCSTGGAALGAVHTDAGCIAPEPSSVRPP
jgi:transcription antitermination factor NusG